MNLKVSNIGNFWITNENSKVNILLIWRWWGNHDAPNLTDSIILTSIDLKTNIISMLSVPRDLLVEVGEKKVHTKINEIYTRNKDWQKKTEEESVKALQDKITQITWQKIDYFVNIDFEWFKKFVDFIGGVEVDVDETIVDSEYPTPDGWYETFILRKWTWILDGEVALKFARSRHSTSDFDRSLRQQKIINAIKNQVIQEGYLSSPSKITKMYEILSEYITTNLDIQTIISLALRAKQENQILSFNLNDSCILWGICYKGWFLYVPGREYFHWWSVLIPQKWDAINIEEYSDILKYSDLIFNNREIFAENLEIRIYNATKRPNLARIFANQLFRFWFNIPDKSLWNTKGEAYTGTVILYNGIDEDSITLKGLSYILNAPLKKVEKPLYSEGPTKIEIVIGDDFETYTNTF